jgi:hypothetical protein
MSITVERGAAAARRSHRARRLRRAAARDLATCAGAAAADRRDADRAQITATQTMATRALQDRGYPLALVSTEETREPSSASR